MQNAIKIFCLCLLLLSACNNAERWEANRVKLNKLIDEEKYKEALSLSKENVNLAKNEFGSKNYRVLISLNMMGTLQMLTGSPEYAEITFGRALDLARAEMDLWKQPMAETLRRVAQLYQKQNKLQEAMGLVREAMELDVKGVQSGELKVSDDLLLMAEAHAQKGDYLSAESLIKRAIDIRKGKLAMDHPLLASAYNQLAGVHFKQEKYVDADSFYQLALGMWRKTYGDADLQLGVLQYNLALVKEKLGNALEAENYFKNALLVHEKQLGSSHPNTMKVLQSFAKFYESIGKVKELQAIKVKLALAQEKNKEK